ncbi:zinc finger BED domain-containing protein RICESLEEPER 2-like [Iris pallida]|uniref:Zinc finger BED domain-containing protein RICESLEEPER 2-like n=1 Tax=Iris pallida TaxID=29817 RepID=A0AAX6DH76_IRIPA|nr:zinc finger BED domain-containing protein RICESLEEPER 2-like [Iris pallida]
MDGTVKLFAKCKHCHTKLTRSTDGCTTTFKRHLNKCCVRLAIQKKQKLLGKDFLLEKSSDGGLIGQLALHKYDKNKVRELLATMITVHEYPFKMVEHEFFVLFCQMLNPEFEMISRVTVKNDCMKLHALEKKKLKEVLGGVTRVSLTSDLWTSNQTIGYMCLTCHYLDSEWTLQKQILNFCSLPPPHTGLAISDAIFACLLDWGIENKISSITLDNASSNDVDVRNLKENFSMKGRLYFKGKVFHVRCCAHILNLMVQDGLNEIKEVIQNIRESVKYLKMSPQRLHKFADIVKQLQLPASKRLVLDVPTRWNSTYAMLDCALGFKKVFSMYQERDPSYTWLPSTMDWERAESVCKILEAFSEASNIFSGTSYPTSNLFLPELWKIKQILNNKILEYEGTFYMKEMVDKMKIKFDKYWGDCNLLMSIAAVLDPRYKMKLIKFCFPRIYPITESDKNIKLVISSLHELYAEYASNIAKKKSSKANDSRLGSTSTSNNFKGKTKGRSEFESWVEESDTVEPSQSELDIYLKENLYKCDESEENFNVLNWWKLSTIKYKILPSMARDILYIPISSVASESAFSAGGRVLDQFRSSLKSETVEDLICSGDWLHSKYVLKNSEVKHDEEDMQLINFD